MTDTTENETHAPSASRAAKDAPGRRWPFILLALLILIAVAVFLSVAEDTADVEAAKAPPPAQLVTIEKVDVAPATVEVTAFAEIRPRWSAELRAAVSGRVTDVLASSLAGERIEAGTTLITIENSRYVAELAAAELALKEARLALWQAKNAAHVARKEYEASGRKPPNDLALRLPQLDIAKSSVASAEARVSAAKRQVEDAVVTAPFSSFVTERFVSPGQTVNPGERLVKLVDSASFELTVELGRRDWALLKQPLAGQSALVVNQNSEIVAQADIRRGGGFLDETTRQYKVFLSVSGLGAEKVLSGDFVRVVLPGITVPTAMNIPASALTQEGHVWHVDGEDRLRRVTPRVLFRRGDRIVIEAPEGADRWRIAVTPLASFLPGQKVRAAQAEG